MLIEKLKPDMDVVKWYESTRGTLGDCAARDTVFTTHEYEAFRTDPCNDHTTDAMWCGTRGIPLSMMSTWKVERTDVIERILRNRRARYSDEMIKVDAALLAKAKSGDARSIQLAWARFENWSPKIEEEASKKSGGKIRTLSELMADIGGNE